MSDEGQGNASNWIRVEDEKSKKDHEKQNEQTHGEGNDGKKLSPEKTKNNTETPTMSKDRNHIRDLSKEFAANKSELVQKQIPQYLNQTKQPTQTSTPITTTTQTKKPSLVSQIVEKFGGKRNETTKEDIDDTINEENETSKNLMKIIRSEEKDEEDEIVFRGTSTADLEDTLGIYSPPMNTQNRAFYPPEDYCHDKIRQSHDESEDFQDEYDAETYRDLATKYIPRAWHICGPTARIAPTE